MTNEEFGAAFEASEASEEFGTTATTHVLEDAGEGQVRSTGSSMMGVRVYFVSWQERRLADIRRHGGGPDAVINPLNQLFDD